MKNLLAWVQHFQPTFLYVSLRQHEALVAIKCSVADHYSNTISQWRIQDFENGGSEQGPQAQLPGTRSRVSEI